MVIVREAEREVSGFMRRYNVVEMNVVGKEMIGLGVLLGALNAE